MDILVEHAPLAKLTSVLPKRAQRGLFSQDITWTCIAANNLYIALGSNIGTVFLYHRSNGACDRLTCKTKNEIVSCVKLQSSYDDVVAAGTASGLVCIFQLPSTLPGRNKRLQLFTIGRSHHSPIRGLAWSSNAMKLFSGDEDGIVICTELDYAKEQSQSFHICKEPHRITQLDYAYKLLLVSTTFRSFLVAHENEEDEVVQVGTKDRKSFGCYGACFLPGVSNVHDAVLFASRPGLRLWKANIEGVVQATYMLRNSPPQGLHQGVNLLPDVLKTHDYESRDVQLGCLHVYQSTLLFTYHERGCYLVDPGLGTIVAHHRNIGDVVDVAVDEKEIFVLRHGHDRPILRLAQEPDSHLGMPESYLERMPGDTPIDILSNTAVKMSGSIIGAFKNVGQKLQAVQEGLDEIDPKFPPWGGSGKRDDVEGDGHRRRSISPETDSAKEANSGLNSPSAHGEGIPEKAEEQKPPIVHLGTLDLPSLQIESEKELFVPRPLTQDQLDDVDQNDDIVFSSKPRKRKVKKKKRAVDKDAIIVDVLDYPSPHRESPTRPSALQTSYVSSPEKEQLDIASALEDLRVDPPPPQEQVATPPHSMVRTPSPRIPSISPSRERTSPLSLPKPPLKRLDSDEILAAIMTQTPVYVKKASSTLTAQSEVDTEDVEKTDIIDAEASANAESPYFPNYTRTNQRRTNTTDTEDFYKMYRSYSVSTTISPPGPGLEQRISECMEDTPPDSEPDIGMDYMKKADVWSTFPGPNNMHSICITERKIWAVDVQNLLYNSWLTGSGLNWKICDVRASQIAVSPAGWIVWRLHKASVHAATGVSLRAPCGTKWVEVARKVRHIAVDNSVAWYVKETGELMVQKDLNRERPAYRSESVEYSEALIQVACLAGVVWVMTESRSIIVRVGVKAGCEEGQEWSNLQGLGSGLIPSNFCLGDQETAWILDTVGRLWFTTGVTSANPQGSGLWWQVSLSSYLMQDATALDIIKNMMSNPRKNLSKLLHGEHEGLLTAAANGLWMCPGNKSVLHVCRGSLIGHRWVPVVLQGMMSSTKWTHLSASGLECSHALLWAQQPNGSIFCFPPDYNSSSRVIEVSSPEAGIALRCLVASTEATWGLSSTGRVFIRAGMAAHCPQGIRWARLDLTQLGESKVISMSCGLMNVWVVDEKGCVFMRIGLKPPSQMALNPAWLPVIGSTNSLKTRFIQIEVGPNDWMVWALDNKNNVYSRKGITDSMPIGTHWVYVEGANAVRLAISERHVYALTDAGEVLVRFGISAEDVLGDYWRVVPGAFTQLSVAADDRLWGLTKDGAIQQRHFYFLQRKSVLDDLGQIEDAEQLDYVYDEWEVI